MMESNGFSQMINEKLDPMSQAVRQRAENKLNKRLTKIEMELFLSVKYNDSVKLSDLAG